MGIINIRKRDGRMVEFDQAKIENAILRAFQASSSAKGRETAQNLAERVVAELENNESVSSTPTVEQVQDTVERVLIEKGFVRSAKAYILYRAERSRVREMNTRLMKTFEDITFKDAIDSDIKRENANINGDTAMGSMLKFGSEGAKQFYDMYVLDPRFAQAHREGDIHIHDLDFYTLTTTCCQIQLSTLFKDGFSTGHGYLREPQDITSYAALCCIAIQANQNDQHGGQSVVDFDYGMAPGVKKTFIKRYRMNIARALELLAGDANAEQNAEEIISQLKAEDMAPSLEPTEAQKAAVLKLLTEKTGDESMAQRIMDFAQAHAVKETDKATFQAMEALVHNLNTMNSRAGAQV
ncbi:MAG: anaerobic ribonucleoside triphosphate reductase, partial [Clostridia bacterium]|nr:anaerobic ribonucleoside triphosphate reductase [Clostridia bacterium]